MKFLTVRLFGKNLFSVQETFYYRDIELALSIYPKTSRKKVYIIFFIRILLLMRLIRLITFKDVDYSKAIKVYTDHMSNKLDGIRMILIWPTSASRKRLYVYTLNSKGEIFQFAKLFFYNATNIENEYKILSFLEKTKNKKFNVPNAYEYCLSTDLSYISTQALPKKAKLINKSNVDFDAIGIDEIDRNHLVDLQIIKQQPWYKYFDTKKGELPKLYSFVNNVLKSDLILLRFSHGDFGSENIFIYNDEFWIIDWERASFYSPVKTDRVAYSIGTRLEDKKSNLLSLRDILKQKYIINRTKHEIVDFLLALVYLSYSEYHIATEILVDFEKTLEIK